MLLARVGLSAIGVRAWSAGFTWARISESTVWDVAGLLGMLTSEVLGVERTPVVIETEGNKRRIVVGKKIRSEIEAVIGGDNETPVMVKNTKYWMGPDVTVAKGNKSRVRAFGRVWDFDGKSGEMCNIEWSGPNR